MREPVSRRRVPEPNFNQMVLKALFTDVRLERIVGLDGRLTPELSRMAAAYASERRAAGPQRARRHRPSSRCGPGSRVSKEDDR